MRHALGRIGEGAGDQLGRQTKRLPFLEQLGYAPNCKSVHFALLFHRDRHKLASSFELLELLLKFTVGSKSLRAQLARTASTQVIFA